MIFKPHNILSIAILALICFTLTFSQTGTAAYSETGVPLMKHYSQKEYKLNSSNWCILQDKRCMMYFGNEHGILQYDGNKWHKIETPYSLLVRSLAMDDNGTIYVCASSDFGYLEPDSLGTLKYKSLIDYLDIKYRKSVEIWDVIANSRGVYFKTDSKIFRWNGKEFNVIDSVYSFRFYKIGDDIYTRNDGTGLMKIEGDSVFIMPGGEYFKKTGVFDMLPYKDPHSNQSENGANKILITTNFKGLHLHDGKNFSPFKTEADSFFVNNQIYNSCITADGNFAFATQRGGVAILDPNGQLLKIINEESGLPTNIVYDVYSDKQGGLWLATANGIVHCEYPSPFSIIPNQGLIKDRVSSMLRFKNVFYVDRVYVGHRTGLTILHQQENKSKFDVYPTVIDEQEISSIVEESNNSLWLLSDFGSLIHITDDLKNLSFEPKEKIKFDRFTVENGLPSNCRSLYNINGKMILVTDKCVFRFNTDSKSFVPDEILGGSFTNSTQTIYIIEKR